MTTRRYLVNDLVAMEDVCNANCSYCITGSSSFKTKHNLKFCEDKLDFHLEKLLDDENSYQEGRQFKERLDKVTEILKETTNPFILKVSGGEILLVKGIQNFIEKQAPLYKRMQVLTNGILLNDELLRCFVHIPNFSLQISMDGHTLELNNYRVKSEALQNKLLKVLALCNEYKINLEINCVLTDRNIEAIYDFAQYLKQYDNVLLQPYPVRGKFREKFIPHKNQLSGLRRLLAEYDDLDKILPPKKYLEELVSFLELGERSKGCSIPSIIYQAFDDGIITPCPNIWYKSFGNILEAEDEVIGKMNNDPFYKITNRKQAVLEECKHCFTPWDMLDLFIKGEISIDEISKIHLYNDPEILAYLKEMQE